MGRDQGGDLGGEEQAVLGELGAVLERVLITEVREHTYYAKLRVRQEGELIEIDTPGGGGRQRRGKALLIGIGSLGLLRIQWCDGSRRQEPGRVPGQP